MQRCIDGEKGDSSNAPEIPCALASGYERPDKAKAIKEHKSKFRRNVIVDIIHMIYKLRRYSSGIFKYCVC